MKHRNAGMRIFALIALIIISMSPFAAHANQYPLQQIAAASEELRQAEADLAEAHAAVKQAQDAIALAQQYGDTGSEAKSRAALAVAESAVARHKARVARSRATLDQAKSAALYRKQDLDNQIDRDMQAIRNLGLNRRAEDFAAWEALALQAKTEFETEVLDVVTNIAIDKVRGRMLDAFKNFDSAKAGAMVAWIRSKNIRPEPATLIARIQKLGRFAGRENVAEDAEAIVKDIENWQAARAAAGDRVETAKFIGGLLEGLLTDPRLSILVTEVKLTAAALYNNVTRRVALHEVDRLVTMTEAQLRALQSLQRVLAKHINERKALGEALGR